MTTNTTAITRGAALAKHQAARQQQQSGIVRIDNPNRQQRRAAEKHPVCIACGSRQPRLPDGGLPCGH